MMKWNHLPREGGINSQDPELWDMFDEIWAAQAKEEKRKADEQERKQGAKGGGIKRPHKGRRR